MGFRGYNVSKYFIYMFSNLDSNIKDFASRAVKRAVNSDFHVLDKFVATLNKIAKLSQKKFSMIFFR